MTALDELLAELDDFKSALYTLVEQGALDENTNDQVQELLREARELLED
jgi:hypothetical protein